ncbi:hypothetical protein KKF32_04975 [Patescibacteria group bacterium]|nr:hypothetical protein [Patescibacteria group bacterium]
MKENWGIIGHQNIVNYLDNSLKKEKVVHTYLFYGVKHLGKTTVAKKFAEELLGQSTGSSNLDLFELNLENHHKEIKIDQVRDWRHFLSLKPFGKGFKVGIIHQSEHLNIESANALLKTIEEPPPKTVIILVTSSWQRLLPTIISRSQKIHFLPVASKIIQETIKGKVSDQKEIKEMVSYALGRPGLALKFCQDQEFKEDYLKLHQQVVKLWSVPIAQRFNFLNDYLGNKELKENFNLIDDLLHHFQFILREKLLSLYQLGDSQTIKSSALIKQLKIVSDIKSLLKFNIQPKLLLENLLINL